MGRSLDTSLPKNPTVRLKDRIGSTFIGVYRALREIKFGDKPDRVYEFEYVSGDAPVTKQGSNQTYVEVIPNVGDVVNLFGTTGINQAMTQAQIGEKIQFKYVGKKKRFQLYEVTVIE